KPPVDTRPDLSATARIVTDTRKQALSIPIIALTVRENKPVSTENRPVDTTGARKKKETEGVFTVKEGVATFRTVKVGIAGDEYFEVTDGLKEGESIVAGPYQAIRDLKDGARVRAMKQPADSSKKKRALPFPRRSGPGTHRSPTSSSSRTSSRAPTTWAARWCARCR